MFANSSNLLWVNYGIAVELVVFILNYIVLTRSINDWILIEWCNFRGIWNNLVETLLPVHKGESDIHHDPVHSNRRKNSNQFIHIF